VTVILAQAMVEYKAHRPATAFNLIDQLAENDTRNGSAYRSMQGLLMIQQRLYRPAAEQFGLNADTLSIYYQALALSKAGDVILARSLWEKAAHNDPTVTSLKQTLYNEQLPQNDLERAFYVVYRPDDANRGKIWEQIKNPDLRTIAGKSLIDQFMATRQWFYAQMILSQLPKPGQLGPYALSIENLSALRLAVARRNGNAAIALAKQPLLPEHAADRAFSLAQAYLLNKQPARAKAFF